MHIVNVEIRDTPVGQGPHDRLADVFLAMECVPQLGNDPHVFSGHHAVVYSALQAFSALFLIAVVCSER